MQLKRYSTKTLQEMCIQIFYDYMPVIINGSKNHETPVHTLHKEYEDKLDLYMQRIKIYQDKIAEGVNGDVRNSLLKQLNYLKEGAFHIAHSNRYYQQELYRISHSTDYARSSVKIPLNKKINSYYDDFILQVVFYDDVATLNGKFDEYAQLKTTEERKQFIKDNTEITHLGLLYVQDNRLISIIALKGELNTRDPRVVESGVALLPQKFSNFDTLTLNDTMDIKNNDLKQFIQSKIDLDKEQMTELSSIIIRGDRYSIHRADSLEDQKSLSSPTLYIRYTCRGTGRVYYNALNLNNLRLSSYFNEDDYDSYSKAWWDLNTLGGNPDSEKPVIRC